MPQRKLLLSLRNIARKILFLLLILFLVSLFLGIILAPFFIRIRIVDCHNQYGDCADDVSKSLSQYTGDSFYKAKKKIRLFLRSEKSVGNFSIQFKLPNTLRVDLLIKKPAFCIGNSDGFLMISETGQVISSTTECSLPKIRAINMNKKVGEKIDDTDFFALKIIQGIYTMYQISEGVVDGNSLTVELKPDLKVIFPRVGDPETLLGALRLIYAKMENEGKSFREIDLRFENPVLR